MGTSGGTSQNWMCCSKIPEVSFRNSWSRKFLASTIKNKQQKKIFLVKTIFTVFFTLKEESWFSNEKSKYWSKHESVENPHFTCQQDIEILPSSASMPCLDSIPKLRWIAVGRKTMGYANLYSIHFLYLLSVYYVLTECLGTGNTSENKTYRVLRDLAFQLGENRINKLTI